MRFFYNVLSRSHDFKWFIFQDDDLYMRPYALLNLLSSDNASKEAIAIVAAKFYRGFRFSQYSKRSAGFNYNCTIEDIHDFPVAQPLFLNYLAMSKLRHAITTCDTMTSLHKIWGGSHDSLVAVMLWMANIPVYSIAR